MLQNIKTDAIARRIPIIQDDALAFIIDLINENKVKSILEIGTAVGYSAISFAKKGIKVTTIEHDLTLYKEAFDNVKKLKLDELIKVVYSDALNFVTNEKFDLIFIDGAKAKYQKFFLRFKNNLNPGGLIICDNINFHNLDKNKVKRRTRKLLEKLEAFKLFLKNNDEFATTFYSISDGLSVSVRK